MRSSRRPGVPTTTSIPEFKALICSLTLTPPITTSSFTFGFVKCFENLANWFDVCSANSLEGYGNNQNQSKIIIKAPLSLPQL